MSDEIDDGVYLDHAATTPMTFAAEEALVRGLAIYGNPSSRHRHGVQAQEALARAREGVSRLLGGSPDEVTFTGGGSESTNLALEGFFAMRGYTGELVTTALEHSATRAAAERLRDRGVTVTVLPSSSSGHVRVEDVRAAVTDQTALISVMHVNNEIGTVQPVEMIIEHAASVGAAVHIDAVQSAGKIPIDHLDAELLGIAAHKLGGPKGIGALRVRRIKISPLILGGSQEAGRRAGTENVPAAVSFAVAAASAADHQRPEERGEASELALRLRTGLQAIEGIRFFGGEPQIAEITSVAFDGLRGDTVADLLDVHDVSVSTGSACHTDDPEPSAVLRAMGVSEAQAVGAVRFSFGSHTSATDIDRAVAATRAAVEQLRVLAGSGRGQAHASRGRA